MNEWIYIYIYIYVTSIFHCLRLFHSPILRPLSLMAVIIPSFQVLWGQPHLFLPTGFHLSIIFGNRIESILSTCPYQMSCFRVISSNIVSGASIFSLIYLFIFLSSLEILADRLNASTSAIHTHLFRTSHFALS